MSRSAGERIIATFIPQARINDYAVEIDGRIGFDVTDQILKMGKDRALLLRDNRYETDSLVPPEILERHNGPFEVRVEDAIREYFENGVKEADPRQYKGGPI